MIEVIGTFDIEIVEFLVFLCILVPRSGFDRAGFDSAIFRIRGVLTGAGIGKGLLR